MFITRIFSKCIINICSILLLGSMCVQTALSYWLSDVMRRILIGCCTATLLHFSSNGRKNRGMSYFFWQLWPNRNWENLVFLCPFSSCRQQFHSWEVSIEAHLHKMFRTEVQLAKTGSRSSPLGFMTWEVSKKVSHLIVGLLEVLI